MTLCEAEKRLRSLFSEAGVDSPGLCARALLSHVTGLSRLDCVLRNSRTLLPAATSRIQDLGARICRGEPLAYVLGHKNFYEHDFLVDSRVLIPRPETELLIDLALERLPPSPLVFADLGSGSGCIGLSLLALRSNWNGLLVDVDKAALQVCHANARMIAPRACIVHADLFSPPFAARSLDLIVANPPYISPDDVRRVMPSVLKHEPHRALFSDNMGLAHIFGVIDGARRSLKPGGVILLEHGDLQQAAILAYLDAAGYTHIAGHRDLAGLARCISAQTPLL